MRLDHVTGARAEELRGQPGLIIATVPGQRDLHLVPEAPPSSGAQERLAIAWVRSIEETVRAANAGPLELPERRNPMAGTDPARRIPSATTGTAGSLGSPDPLGSLDPDEARASDAARLGRILAGCADAVGRARTITHAVEALSALQGALRRDTVSVGRGQRSLHLQYAASGGGGGALTRSHDLGF